MAFSLPAATMAPTISARATTRIELAWLVRAEVDGKGGGRIRTNKSQRLDRADEAERERDVGVEDRTCEAVEDGCGRGEGDPESGGDVVEGEEALRVRTRSRAARPGRRAVLHQVGGHGLDGLRGFSM